ncbi:MAG: hypothetical protein NC541_03675 [bacterium]|nr:hypothetical protein [bacterium]
MEKYQKSYRIAWGIAVVLFVGTALLIPNEIGSWSKNEGSFWAAFVMILLVFAGQLGCSAFLFRKADPGRRFLQLPIVSVSYLALLITLIVEIVCVVVPTTKNWLGFALGFLILACYGIAVAASVSGAKIIEEKERERKEETRFLYALRTEAELLLKQTENPKIAPIVKKVSEAVRYSDPRGNAALEELEGRLYVTFAAFSEAAQTGDEASCGEKAETFLKLLEERNSKCRLLK